MRKSRRSLPVQPLPRAFYSEYRASLFKLVGESRLIVRSKPGDSPVTDALSPIPVEKDFQKEDVDIAQEKLGRNLISESVSKSTQDRDAEIEGSNANLAGSSNVLPSTSTYHTVNLSNNICGCDSLPTRG
mgnify:CR=1 FL=1